MDQGTEHPKIALLVPKAHVKHVKSALEKHNQFDRASRITPEETNTTTTTTTQDAADQRMRIPTTIPLHPSTTTTTPDSNKDEDEDAAQTLSTLLAALALTHLAPSITLSRTPPITPPAPREKNPLRRAIASALAALPASVFSALDLTPAALTAAFPDAYSIYPPMLLLPAGTFSAPAWKALLAAHPPGSAVSEELWARVVSEVGVTHVALNSPIPMSNCASTSITSTSTSPPTTPASPPALSPSPHLPASTPTPNENILRSPHHLTPLHGPWGPAPTPRSTASPTPADFAAATWVRTRQNGIWQVWAPRYTMFSRGNMREKTRILALPGVAFEAGSTKARVAGEEGGEGVKETAQEKDKDDAQEKAPEKATKRGKNPTVTPATAQIAALDLYAGIGYFAFSYRARGARVACWELNPWSIEGLRRGAAMNGWTTSLIPSPSPSPYTPPTADILIHPHTNTTTLTDLAPLRAHLAPIRHINLGLLPVSRPTWRTAVRALDAECGGWIHAHENVGEWEVEARRGEVEGVFRGLVREVDGEGEVEGGKEGRREREVSVVHVERVKLYAPGVVHVVFDVWVGGTA